MFLASSSQADESWISSLDILLGPSVVSSFMSLSYRFLSARIASIFVSRKANG